MMLGIRIYVLRKDIQYNAPIPKHYTYTDEYQLLLLQIGDGIMFFIWFKNNGATISVYSMSKGIHKLSIINR